MKEPKYIKDWNELQQEQSPTHIIKMDKSGYCGLMMALGKINVIYQRIISMVALVIITQRNYKNVDLM